MMRWPRGFSISAATILAVRSDAPPGPCGMMRLMGRLGCHLAWAMTPMDMTIMHNMSAIPMRNTCFFMILGSFPVLGFLGLGRAGVGLAQHKAGAHDAPAMHPNVTSRARPCAPMCRWRGLSRRSCGLRLLKPGALDHGVWRRRHPVSEDGARCSQSAQGQTPSTAHSHEAENCLTCSISSSVVPRTDHSVM